jgi:hypothetical protein
MDAGQVWKPKLQAGGRHGYVTNSTGNSYRLYSTYARFLITWLEKYGVVQCRLFKRLRRHGGQVGEYK